MTTSPAPTLLTRLAPGLVGFLHHFTLGAAFPLLPLYLTSTLGLSWTHTSIVLTSLPLSLLVGSVIVRSLGQLGVDVRLGITGSHLLAAGVVMSFGIWRQRAVSLPVDWLPVFAIALLYFSLLSSAVNWLSRLKNSEASSSHSITRNWRAWGAAGFVAPAWLCESILPRFEAAQSQLASYDILFAIAGWAGLCTAFSALLLAEQTTSPATEETFPPEQSPGLGISLAIALILMVVVQRCTHLWTAPFFEYIVQQHRVERPLVYRLTVTDQVFELVALYLIGFALLNAGPRLTLSIGTLAWFARAVLLGVTAESVTETRTAMTCLLAAQILGGIGAVSFFGSMGMLLGAQRSIGVLRPQILLAAIAGAAGTMLGGSLSAELLEGNPQTTHIKTVFTTVSPLLKSIGVPFATTGWPGIWSFLSIPALLALPCVLASRHAGRVFTKQGQHSDP